MKVGNRSRRIKVAAAATGVVALGVLATPGLAGAQEHDGHEPTTTTVAEATTTTTAPTGTTAPTTTTTWTPPPPPDVLEVFAPGDTITRSGTDCLIDGEPGYLLLVYGDGDRTFIESHGTADADGSWSIRYTVPADLNGLVRDVYGCADESGSIAFTLGAGYYLVEKPGSPPFTGDVVAEARELRRVVDAKLTAPKAIKAKATYTG